MPRPRLRELGITIGQFPPGPYNAITDVPGVLVGHKTLIADHPRTIRTGVTVIVPRYGQIWDEAAFAGIHSFNGCGELTGSHWIQESGMLNYPIALTNSHQVGTVHEAIVAYGQETGKTTLSALSVVGETWDGWLHDMDAFPLTKADVYEALANAQSGAVAEGNVGGGTGMICYEFKGGIGTASRQVTGTFGQFTIGALVQANHGARPDLRVNGVPLGLKIGLENPPTPWGESPNGGSILVIIATDAPLLPFQCRRLAQRAAIGFARTGGMGHNGSGDLFLAFATGNLLPAQTATPYNLQMFPNHWLNPFFVATAEAVEEAILNVLTAAETMTGFQGHTAHALPLDQLTQWVKS